jgi:hypothetical protein
VKLITLHLAQFSLAAVIKIWDYGNSFFTKKELEFSDNFHFSIPLPFLAMT